MGSSRNRNAGNNLERRVMHDMQEIYPKCKTSRNESRTLDAKKVDLTDTPPFAFQIKSSATRVPYDSILEEMDTEDVKVVIHDYTEKKGTRFYSKERYAIMHYQDFLDLIFNAGYGTNNEKKKNKEIIE